MKLWFSSYGLLQQFGSKFVSEHAQNAAKINSSRQTLSMKHYRKYFCMIIFLTENFLDFLSTYISFNEKLNISFNEKLKNSQCAGKNQCMHAIMVF